MNIKIPDFSNLPKRWAIFCLDIEKISRELGIRKGDRVLLSISGGADSTALALIYHFLQTRLGIDMAALHVNHQLREEADGDAEFVTDLCDLLKMPCKVARVDINALALHRKIGLEEAGRKARHEICAKYRSAMGAKYALLGHQLGDLCEDVLMRLLRGTGWPALGGMRQKENFYLRPLLMCPSQTLRDFLLNLGVPWREDASNKDGSFLRNRMRQGPIPFLMKENPNFGNHVAHLNKLARLDEDYWNDFLENALARDPAREYAACGESGLILPAKLLKALPKAGRLRLYHKMIKLVARNSGQARGESIFMLDEAFEGKKTGRIFQFPGNIFARIDRSGLFIYKLKRV